MSKADKSPVELPSPAVLRHPFFGQPRSGSSLRRCQAPRPPKLTTTEAPAGADDLPNRPLMPPSLLAPSDLSQSGLSSPLTCLYAFFAALIRRV